MHSFGFVIGHIIGEHRWTDTMFPDFFERYGGVYGVNVKDRLAEIGPRSKVPWVAFLDYIGGSASPYFRYLLHIDTSVDIRLQRITLTAGQGVAFNYSFNRYQVELAMILTDCSAFQFFEMYDRFGPGFAAQGNWANQPMPQSALSAVGYTSRIRYAPGLGPGGAASGAVGRRGQARVEIPAELPEAARMKRGEKIYSRECVDCHGETGNGAGFLDGSRQTPRLPASEVQVPLDAVSSFADDGLTSNARFGDGVPGTAMPALGTISGGRRDRRRGALLGSVLAGVSCAHGESAVPPPLKISPVPPEVDRLAAHPIGDPHPCSRAPLARSYACDGEKLWHVMLCRWCHGDQGQGDGPISGDMTDEWGNPIIAAEF